MKIDGNGMCALDEEDCSYHTRDMGAQQGGIMGVLVTDMEMPTGCVSCEFVRFLSDGGMYCWRLKRVVRTGTARLDGCPLRAEASP